ncbi:MAG: creatininase family protein, partial [Actinomycetota bacterium]
MLSAAIASAFTANGGVLRTSTAVSSIIVDSGRVRGGRTANGDTITSRVVVSVLEDIGRCVAATPARKLVFLNGHGGNSALVAMANRELRLQFGLETFLAHPSQPADQGGASSASELGMGVHGGHDETSMMLYLHPELVDMSLAVRDIPEHLAANRHVRFGGSVAFGWLSNDFGDHGHIGDPTAATAEHGRVLVEGAIESFVDVLREVATFRHRA